MHSKKEKAWLFSPWARIDFPFCELKLFGGTETYVFNLCEDENSSNTILLAFLVIQPIHIIQAKALLNRWTICYIVAIQLKVRLVEKQVSGLPLCVENFLP